MLGNAYGALDVRAVALRLALADAPVLVKCGVTVNGRCILTGGLVDVVLTAVRINCAQRI